MECVECEDCGSVIKRDFKDCPYCDFRIKRGGFWNVLSALAVNAASQQAHKNTPVLITVD